MNSLPAKWLGCSFQTTKKSFLLYFLLTFILINIFRKEARSVISSFLTNQLAKGENNPGTTMFLQYQHVIDIYGSGPRDMNKHFVLKGDYDILA